ncbi:MAG: response regulator [Flavobacteriales bacterium]|nr:response regulator [Flavobacteriales bacterium]MCB9167851.1 response regulator [Flavobacteriales bacterium]
MSVGDRIFSPGERTVLIVDDSPESLTAMVELLGDAYRVKVAKNGAKALELAATAPQPDLILLDVMMPGMDGYEVCRRLKEDAHTQDIPVIFLTSLNDPSDEARGFELGAADYIAKPFEPVIFTARVRTQLELVHERKRTQSLLTNFLPPRVIQELMRTGTCKPEHVQELSLLFADLVGFTRITEQISKEGLLDGLSAMFSAFDAIMERHGGQRLKTIGDAYVGVVGLDHHIPDHADRAVQAGLDMIAHMRGLVKGTGPVWEVRIGVHTGSVIAGVVGESRYQYDIFGDDVNIAARVEAASEPMRLTVTAATRRRLSEQGLVITPRGMVDLKGKGQRELFFVERAPWSAT